MIENRDAPLFYRVLKKTKNIGLISGASTPAWLVREIIENIGQDIIWVNGIRDDVKKEFYKYASCLIAPSKTEAFGLSVVEANSTGTPAVVLNNTSLPEIVINGENGYLVENEEEMMEDVENLE